MKRHFLLLLTAFSLVSCNYSQNTNNVLPTQTNDEQKLFASQREIVSRALGDAPNFSQTSNGNFSAVISRDFGRGAKAGAIIEFLYPNYARDHLWDAYNGIYLDGKLTWFHELNLVNQSIKEDSGIIVSEFSTKNNSLDIKTEDVALRNNDTLVRHVEITNKTSKNINDLKLFFYEFFTVNYLGAGDELIFDEKSSTLVHSENNVVFTIGSNKKVDQWQCGGAENLITNAYDARKDAEDGELRNNDSVKGRIGLGVNGNLGHNISSLKPGETFSIDYFISVGQSFQESFSNYSNASSKNWNSIEQDEFSFWKSWLSKATKPKTSDTRLNRVYKRSLITMKQNTANNGAIIASPTLLSPVYAFTWPRDGTVSASAFLEAGYKDEARKFLDFIVKQQKSNGGWAVNFFMDGSRPLWDFGDRKNEHDQVGTVIWSIYEYYQHTKDINWLRGKWDSVQRASDFLLKYKDSNDLMESCRDLWELHTDKSWTFTNAAASSGLLAASEIANIMGYKNLAEKYKVEGESIRQAIYENLWDESGKFYVRGMNNNNRKYDFAVETANLGLSYPFEVFPYSDKRMNMMADKIYSTLSSPQKGIKRYTNDKYYDGNPWPATTDWLAIYYSKQGNKQRAIELHNSITNYAFATNSLMLGEQFDENKKLWVSAFPLTWSASKYVLSSLEIYK